MKTRKEPVKIGIVGLCRGLEITGALHKHENARLTAICDLRADRRENAVKFFAERGITDLEVYDNYEDFLRSDVEAVVLATDAPLHAAMSIQALEAGKHVLSEIPAVHTMEDVKSIAAAVKAHPNQKYMVAENCCYWAFIQLWKTMYENGDLGDCVYAESEYLHSTPDSEEKHMHEFNTWRREYTSIRYLTHNLGPLLYLLDDRCVSVSCMVPDHFNNKNKDRAECANGVAIFKTAKGAVIRIFIGFGAYVGFDHNFALYGTHGSIYTDRTARLEDAHSFAKTHKIPGSIHKAVDIPITLQFPTEYGGDTDHSGHGGADDKMLRAFVRCIAEDTKPPIDIDLGMRLSIPGMYAEQSLRQGGALVEIPSLDDLLAE